MANISQQQLSELMDALAQGHKLITEYDSIAKTRFMASFFSWVDDENGQACWHDLVSAVQADSSGWSCIGATLDALESFCIRSDITGIDLIFYKSKRNRGTPISFENIEKVLTVKIFR